MDLRRNVNFTTLACLLENEARQWRHFARARRASSTNKWSHSSLALHGTRLASKLDMLDRSLGGIRCLTVRRIAHHGGYLPGRMAGTIRYTTENLGRTLVRVDFDSGQSLMVLPDDVILDVDSQHRSRDDT